MRWLLYMRLASCMLGAVDTIIKEVELAKDDDGKVTADEVMVIIDKALESISKCLIVILKA